MSGGLLLPHCRRILPFAHFHPIPYIYPRAHACTHAHSPSASGCTRPWAAWLSQRCSSAPASSRSSGPVRACVRACLLVSSIDWKKGKKARIHGETQGCPFPPRPLFPSHTSSNPPTTSNPIHSPPTGDQAGSSPRCLRVWNTKRHASLYDLGFVSKILAVKMNRCVRACVRLSFSISLSLSLCVCVYICVCFLWGKGWRKDSNWEADGQWQADRQAYAPPPPLLGAHTPTQCTNSHIYRRRLVVCLEKSLYLFDLQTMQRLQDMDTAPNPKGLVALSPREEPRCLFLVVVGVRWRWGVCVAGSKVVGALAMCWPRA
jgi:hypothetical protein